jgi:hypothetical protein
VGVTEGLISDNDSSSDIHHVGGSSRVAAEGHFICDFPSSPKLGNSPQITTLRLELVLL